MSSKRFIHGAWLIEKDTGRTMVSRVYDRTEIDMDLIGPYLSATHTFIDRASRESLKTIDTESSKFVWETTDQLLLVMAVSKNARPAHIRFLLRYCINEFMSNHIPPGETLSTMLKSWTGSADTFQSFANFLDELVEQYESTDESLVASKSMDCLEVYNHLFRSLMSVKVDHELRERLVSEISRAMEPLIKKYPFLSRATVDTAGIEALDIDVAKSVVEYRVLRKALEELFVVVTQIIKRTVDTSAFRNMIFDHVMPYVKRDMDRLQTYAILDNVIRNIF